jgi:predicted transcriptional regulator
MAASYSKNCKSKSPDFKILSITTNEIESAINKSYTPPDGWCSYEELSDILNIDRSSLKGYIAKALQQNKLVRQRFHNIDGRLLYYCKVDEVKNILKTRIPKGYYTAFQLSELLNTSHSYMRELLYKFKRHYKVEAVKIRDFSTTQHTITSSYYNLKQLKPLFSKNLKLRCKQLQQL